MCLLAREYARINDVGAEGQILIQPGDKMAREESVKLTLKDWVDDLDKKVDKLVEEGCSHRGNDLAKLARIETATDGVKNQAELIKDSVYKLSLSFAEHKTRIVEANGTTDNKINNLKIGILAQCALLLLVIVGFLFKEFVIPSTKNNSNYSQTPYRSGGPMVSVDVETWNKMVQNEMEKKKK